MTARTKARAAAKAGNPKLELWARIEERAALLEQAARSVVEIDRLPLDSELGRRMRALVDVEMAAIKALPPLKPT